MRSITLLHMDILGMDHRLPNVYYVDTASVIAGYDGNYFNNGQPWLIFGIGLLVILPTEQVVGNFTFEDPTQ